MPARYRWHVADRNQLSPGGAIVIGVFFGAMGTFIVLLALGTFGDPHLSDGTPPWVGVAAGMAFLLGGLAIIVGYGVAGGVAPDGDLPAGTPFFVRLVQYALGLGITTILASIASWVAFGSGSRHFSGSGPFISGAVNEPLGRTVFGIGAVLIWAIMAAMLVLGIKRLRRP
jgi:hypothetical protein